MKPERAPVFAGALASVLCAHAAAAPARDEESRQDEPESATPLEVDGSLQLRYRLRRIDDEEDQDVVSLLHLDLRPSDSDLSMHFLGRGGLDLRDQDERELFEASDTFDHRWTGRVYDAYLRHRALGPLDEVKLGRQTAVETPVVLSFDGASIRNAPYGPWRLQASAYGGVPVHFHESESAGDLVGGLAVEARPLSRTRLRVDWLHIDDERSGQSFDDDLTQLTIWQSAGENLHLEGRGSWLDGDPYRLRFLADLLVPGAGLDLTLRYHELLRKESSQSLELDPFFLSAFDVLPYRELGAAVARQFGDHLDLQVGFDVRRLSEGASEERFNHEFTRWSLQPTLRDLGREGMELSAVADLWNSDGEDIHSFGADARWPLAERLIARLGSSFSLYETDLFRDEERERVRTWFAGLDAELPGDVKATVEYEFQRDSLDRYHELELRLRWRF